MRRWLRRILLLLLFFVWLIFMSFPVVAFVLATQGEFQWGESDGRHLRVFLVQEREANGVGIEWSRLQSRDTHCYQTTLSYLMWEGEGENSSFCQCYDEDTNAPLPVLTQSCKEL